MKCDLYIAGMALWCLTKEKVDEICKNRDAKAEELYLLKKKTPSDLWRFDLNAFLEELNVSIAQTPSYSHSRENKGNKIA